MFKTWTGGDRAMAPMQSPQSAGAGVAGGVGSPGGWHPTILYLIALIFVEMAVIGFLSRTVLR
jgi:hypothetical protein